MEGDSQMDESVASSFDESEDIEMVEKPLGGIHAQLKEGTQSAAMGDISKTWTAPDKSFSKCVLKPGCGFAAPNDGARCCVTLRFPALDASASTTPCLDLGYPVGEEVDIVLGNGFGKYSDVIDACLETMHQGEECALNILDGQNREKHQQFVQGKSSSDVESGAVGDTCHGVVASLHVTLHSFVRNKDIFEMSVADILVRAKELKEIGTQCFKGGDHHLAEQFYIRALRCLISVCHPKDVKDLDVTEKQEYLLLKRTCSLNLAACQLKRKRYSDVISHCSYALQEEPENTKALYRRCQAYLALDEFESCRMDIQTALQQEPKNKLFLEQQRLLVKREKQVYNKLSVAMNKMFGGGS